MSQIYVYIIGFLQLASKRVLSGSDCLKIDGGWGTGGAYSAPPDALAVLRGPTSKGRRGRKGSKGKREEGEGEWRKGKELVGLGLSPSKVKFLQYVTAGY